MNSTLIKILGLAATAIGIGATFLTNWVEDKKMDEKIDERVSEALAKRDGEES